MSDLRAAVFGTSGGIGAALAAQLEASGQYGEVHCGARKLPDATHPFTFDLADEASLDADITATFEAPDEASMNADIAAGFHAAYK